MFEQDSFVASTVGDALAANAITEPTVAADTSILNCFMFVVSNNGESAYLRALASAPLRE